MTIVPLYIIMQFSMVLPANIVCLLHLFVMSRDTYILWLIVCQNTAVVKQVFRCQSIPADPLQQFSPVSLNGAAQVYDHLRKDLRADHQLVDHCKFISSVHPVVCSRHGSAESHSVFQIVDLGVDVSAEQFVEAVRRNPDAGIVCISSLLTTSMPEMRHIVQALNELDSRKNFKIMIGGGSVTREFAEEIGADAYTEDAAEAAEFAESVFGPEEK